LIDVLRSQSQLEEAFTTAMRAFGPGRDISVGASAGTAWIIDENVRRGRVAAARDIADRAAKTGSYVGLLVQARLAERLGDLAKATRLLAELDHTYRSEESKDFRLRLLAREGKGHDELAQVLSGIGGPSRFMLNSGEEVPGLALGGQWFEGLGPARHAQADGMGLKPGDVITRVNAFEIANSDQFWAVLSLSDDPNIEVTVRSDFRPPGPVVLRGPFWHADHGLITR